MMILLALLSLLTISRCEKISEKNCKISVIIDYANKTELNCSNEVVASQVTLPNVEKIIWSGKDATKNLKYLGLDRVTFGENTKVLQIEDFVVEDITQNSFKNVAKNIRTLILKRNKFKILNTTALYRLSKLENLIISQNGIENISSVYLYQFPLLKRLETDANKIRFLIKKNQILDDITIACASINHEILMENFAKHTRNLNVLTSAKKFTLSKLNNSVLVNLNLRLRQTSKFVHINSISSIKKLKIESEIVDAEKIVKLENLMSLENLSIHNIISNGTIQDFISNSVNLKYLNMSFCNIKQLQPNLIENLNGLEVLDVRENDLFKFNLILPVTKKPLRIFLDCRRLFEKGQYSKVGFTTLTFNNSKCTSTKSKNSHSCHYNCNFFSYINDFNGVADEIEPQFFSFLLIVPIGLISIVIVCVLKHCKLRRNADNGTEISYFQIN